MGGGSAEWRRGSDSCSGRRSTGTALPSTLFAPSLLGRAVPVLRRPEQLSDPRLHSALPPPTGSGPLPALQSVGVRRNGVERRPEFEPKNVGLDLYHLLEDDGEPAHDTASNQSRA